MLGSVLEALRMDDDIISAKKCDLVTDGLEIIIMGI
jgi:hypothetical protein